MYTCSPSYSACVLVDGMGGALGVTVYNLAATTHFTTGDVLTIPDPLLCHTSTLDEVRHVCVCARLVHITLRHLQYSITLQ